MALKLATGDVGTIFQRTIRDFLESIGFADGPEGSENFTLGGQEIDAFGREGDLYVVVDAKTRTALERRGRNVRSYLSIINGYKSEVIADIRSRYEELHGYRETIFIFWTKNLKIKRDAQERARELRISLRDDFDLEHYEQALQLLQSKDIVRNSFLKDIKLQIPELTIFSEGHSINAKTVRTKIGSKTLYTFPIQVEYLLRFGYVFRIEMNSIIGESYQRLLKENKIHKIREYLQGGGYFPNNIIAVSEEPLQDHFTPEGEETDEHAPFTLGELTLPNKPCYLEIIDGQHRLYGYSNQSALQNQCLWVTIVEGLTPIDRAKLFVKINRTQTPVPSDILWDLYQISEPTSIRGKISKFVYELNEVEPLKDLISLPRVRSSIAYLSFSNCCSSLASRSHLFSTFCSQESFKSVVRAFFEAIKCDAEIREDWGRSISEKGKKGFVCTNNSISISMRLLAKLLRRTGLPSNEEIEPWKRHLDEWIISSLKEYLAENAGDDEEDPYKELRKLTSEGARKDAANSIWERSPLFNSEVEVEF